MGETKAHIDLRYEPPTPQVWISLNCCSHMGVSKNNGTPKIIHFQRVFHYFHHPFWGTPIFGNTHIYHAHHCIQGTFCQQPWRPWSNSFDLIPAMVILLMDEIRPTTCYLSHRIHVWYICLHFGCFLKVNVAETTSPMDPMTWKPLKKMWYSSYHHWRRNSIYINDPNKVGNPHESLLYASSRGWGQTLSNIARVYRYEYYTHNIVSPHFTSWFCN